MLYPKDRIKTAINIASKLVLHTKRDFLKYAIIEAKANTNGELHNRANAIIGLTICNPTPMRQVYIAGKTPKKINSILVLDLAINMLNACHTG